MRSNTKYPLLRDSDFAAYIDDDIGGYLTLLIPRNKSRACQVTYGIGHLRIFSYLHELFQVSDEFTAGDLIGRMDEVTKIMQNIQGKGIRFFDRTLRKFAIDNIIFMKGISNRSRRISDDEPVSRGNNYDLARIKKVDLITHDEYVSQQRSLIGYSGPFPGMGGAACL